MQGLRVLVVDDEPSVCEVARLYLEREGFTVESVGDGLQALAVCERSEPALVVLDLMLPGLDGWEVCARLRERSSVPIIMLTARGEDEERIHGLELGADDYLAKPFNPRELAARVKAVLRRGRGGVAGWADRAVKSGAITPMRQRDMLTFAGLRIEWATRCVYVGSEPVQLTPKEFELLWRLASAGRRVWKRQELLEQIWGYDFFGDERTIDVHIKRLRQKVEPPGHPYRYIQTVWGVGYQFEVKPA